MPVSFLISAPFIRKAVFLANVPLQAVLDTFEYSLRDVINWKVGTRIPLNATPQSDIALLCGDVPMFSGRMGRKGGNIAVRIAEKVERIRGLP